MACKMPEINMLGIAYATGWLALKPLINTRAIGICRWDVPISKIKMFLYEHFCED
jgi:hypothetical protein